MHAPVGQQQDIVRVVPRAGAAFADPKPVSKGFHGALTDRRAMPLVNVRYYPRARFFWDERAGNLEEMVLLPIESRIEMGQDLKQVADTLGRDAAYPPLFAHAFGQSRYDEGRARAQSARDDFDNFTLQENHGKALFMRNCMLGGMSAPSSELFRVFEQPHAEEFTDTAGPAVSIFLIEPHRPL